MKIRSVRAYLFHADGQTDKHDEANSHISEFCERDKENKNERKSHPHFLSKERGIYK
jgi:hypothetical protein